MMPPRLCYTIWFSQRVGSSLLCQLLASTGVAGNPGEWLNFSSIPALHDHHRTRDPEFLRQQIWNAGSVGDVFGLKFGPHQPYFDELLETLGSFPGVSPEATPQQIWANAFPNSKHIFLTRRDKVKLAVSWWKAVQTRVWVRASGDADVPEEGGELIYSYKAINKLRNEAVEREALIREFLAGFEEPYLTLSYEELAAAPQETVRRLLGYLGIDENVTIGPIGYEKLADELSLEWVNRFKAQQRRVPDSNQNSE